MMSLSEYTEEPESPVKNIINRKYHIIYKTTCLVTGKYYIGMHSTDDLDDGYLGSGKLLGRSIKKYGEDQHERVILEDCSMQGRPFLRQREAEIVDEKMLEDPLCMNLTKGGNVRSQTYSGFYRHPEETRQKISQAHKGRKHSEETKQKRKGNKNALGHEVSEETRQKISQANMGHKCPEELKQLLSELHRGNKYRLGKEHTDETKRKISEANKGTPPPNKGKPMPEQQRQSLIGNQYAKGAKRSAETKKRMSEAQRSWRAAKKLRSSSDALITSMA